MKIKTCYNTAMRRRLAAVLYLSEDAGMELLDSKWFYWVVTGIIAAIWAALLYFVKRQRDADDARFRAIEKRQEEDRERINKLMTDLPLLYVLREDHIRTMTAQNLKLDKVADLQAQTLAEIAALKGRQKQD